MRKPYFGLFSSAERQPFHDDGVPARQTGAHARTDTVDYVICIAGEIDMFC